MTRVAFVGLGAMGSRMAGRLIDAGHELVVWNRTAAKTAPLVDIGAGRADTPGEAAERAEVVVTMVADPAALRDVTEGSGKVIGGLRPGTTLIEMSTVGPASIARLASLLPAEVDMLDAPVLGSLGEAESGTLRIFIGGPENLAARWTPLLSALGTPTRVGGRGAGATAKLVANTTLLTTVTALGEALAMADRLGLSRTAAFDVLSATPLSAQAERRRPAIESGDYPPRFALRLARKDADLIADEGRYAGLDLRLVAAARTWLADAEAAGLGDRDYTAVLSTIAISPQI